MENEKSRIKEQLEEQFKIERRILLVYCLYCILFTSVTMRGGWPLWLAAVIDVSWLAGFVIHMAGVRNYQFRACFMAGMIQIQIVMWSVCIGSLSMAIPVLAAFTVALGLYGIPELMYISVASVTFLNFYHILIVRSIDFTSGNTAIQTVLEIAAVYFIIYAIRILNKKQLEDVEKQMDVIESLKGAERSKDDFLANISHEIRTPINTICGMSEIVLREELSDEVRTDVYSIQAAGRNLLSIVSDVLDFSELQSGKMALAEETYNITSTVNDVINMSMAHKVKKQIELIVDCDANLPSGLHGDEQKIRRIILNLMDNALKFTEEGCVSICINFRKTDYGINLVVCVRDTGIGLTEENVEKLFTSFNQIDAKRSRKEGGIGLGLAISQAMVEKMGGFITVSSEYGSGSEFQFAIPQEVVDHTPIAVVREPERLNVAVYINMEQFDRIEIRDEYDRVIRHMIGQLKVKSHFCQNLAELKRRAEREIFSHIFISMVEYEEARNFFDKLSGMTKVIMILDRLDDERIQNEKIYRLYKPLFILPIVMILNEEKIIQGMDENCYHHGRFAAPDVNVLAVDDNLMNIRVLEGLLRPYKIKLSMATSGAEALDKIDSMNYDLIFMDHMMPQMDGIETMHRIRQKQGNYFKKIPIIALTANAIGGMREVFLGEGFQDFMSKPIELSVLERVLRRNLPQEKMMRAEEEREKAAGKAAKEYGKAVREGAIVHEKPRYAETEEYEEAVNAEAEMHEIQKCSESDEREPVTCAAGVKNAEKADQRISGKSLCIEAGIQETEPRTDLPSERFHEQMGIKYCGGLENYIEILKITYRSGEDYKAKLQKCFDGQDWKNYTIYVHALKSSMINIGAEQLAGLAKELELAGRQDDETFILEHHDAMMQEYAQVLLAIKKSRIIDPCGQAEAGNRVTVTDMEIENTAEVKMGKAATTVHLEPIEDAQLDQYAAAFEEAAFAFDEDAMMSAAQHLMQCSYRGHSLQEPMERVMKKVRMSDYMSASEIIFNIKKEFFVSYR